MRNIKIILFALVTLCLIDLVPALSSPSVTFDFSPRVSPRGDKWRIGYYEGGPYIDYQKTLLATIEGLMELGWIRKAQLDTLRTLSSEEIWVYLSSKIDSDYIQFVNDGFYSSRWDPDVRDQVRSKIIKRLNDQKDIDLMFALGTWAGQDLANNHHQVPTLVMSTSDAVSAGIVKSLEDSGRDHLHAHIDPSRNKRQLELFYKVVKFKTLGVIYEDSVAGRSYAALGVIKELAQRFNFRIKECIADSDIPDAFIAEQQYRDCFKRLAESVDAIYVTVHGGVTERSIPKLADIAIQSRVPTFSQSGADEVKYGLLMSLSPNTFRHVGIFEAGIIAKVFNGAKPGELEQAFDEPPLLAINLETAELIGFYEKLTADVLASSDVFYEEILQPE